jgi:hypothetical protein
MYQHIKYLIFLTFFILSSCSPVTNNRITKPTGPKTYSNSYEMKTSRGHTFKIEIDYTAKELSSLNNDCEAQYIITNIGTKDYLINERYPFKVKIRGVEEERYDTAEMNLIFEFTTSDGKKIEEPESMNSDIRIGKTSSAKKVSIHAGNRICVGEVKPVRIGWN